MLKVLKLAEQCLSKHTARCVLSFLPDLLLKDERKAAAKNYPTCLDSYGSREPGLSEAKGMFTFAFEKTSSPSSF